VDTTPTEFIREYLNASSERRMSDAASYLAEEAALVFPQGRFNGLEAMAAAMSGRYRTISKRHDTWDVVETDGDTVVVTTGTLSGVNTHGVSFENIRFCDRFVLRNGRIMEQHVWNDLAESGVLDQT
jgi:hypothetical protein